ncbi:MAG: glycosyltransferase family 39 protein, partial [bacterium]
MVAASPNQSDSPTRGQPPRAWPWWLISAYVAFLFMSLSAVIWGSLRADAAGEMCLASLTPLIQGIVQSGRWLSQDASQTVPALGWILFGLIGLLAVGGVVMRKRQGIRPALILAAGALAVLAQTACFSQIVLRGCVLYGAVAVLVLVWRVLPRSLGPGISEILKRNEDPGESSRKKVAFLLFEAFCLVLITLGTILYRFYALNHLPADFDGEMALYMAVSTSIDGLLKVHFVNSGLFWSPLGLFYYLFLHISETLFGTTLLAVRFVPAIGGVLLIPLFYGLLRRLGGATAAIIGTAFLVFSPLEI